MKKITAIVPYTRDGGKTIDYDYCDAWIVPGTGESIVLHKPLYNLNRGWWNVSHQWTGCCVFPVF